MGSRNWQPGISRNVKGGKYRPWNAIVFIGGRPGGALFSALRIKWVRELIRTGLVLVDKGNFTRKRFYRWYQDPEGEEDRLYDAVLDSGFNPNRVWTGPWNEHLEEKLKLQVALKQYNMVLICCWGTKVPEWLVELIGIERCIVFHPCEGDPRIVNPETLYLPKSSKGIGVVGQIVSQQESMYNVAALEAAPRFDSGLNRGLATPKSIIWTRGEMSPEMESYRAQNCIAALGPVVQECFTKNILKIAFPKVADLRAFQLGQAAHHPDIHIFTGAELYKHHGYQLSEVLNAGYDVKDGEW